MKQAQHNKWFVGLGDALVPCGTYGKAQREYEQLIKERPVVTVSLVMATPQGLQAVRTYANGVERRIS